MADTSAVSTETRIVRRGSGRGVWQVDADICVVGSGAAGMAAAHALDLAGTGSVHRIDLAALAERVRDNVERTD